jgi:tetratricopeptide (TPR) repeat protein
MSSPAIPQFAVTHEHYLGLVPAMQAIAGNEDTDRLARALALSEGFALHLAACETPLLAQALLLCIANRVPALRGSSVKVVRLTPTRTADAPLEPRSLGREVFDRLFLPDTEARIICLDVTDSRSDDRDAWLWLFQRLNERRNHLYAIKAPLLFLLPFDLWVELTRFAPDLWSIRGMGIRLLSEPIGERRGLDLPSPAYADDQVRRSIADTNIQRLEINVAELLPQRGPHAKRALLVEAQRLAEALKERGQDLRVRELLEQKIFPALKSAPREVLPEMMFGMVETLVRLGETEQAERLAREEALPALERIGNHVAIATLFARLGDAYRHSGDFVRALEMLEKEALPRAEQLEDHDIKAEVLSRSITILMYQGDLERAQELLAQHETLLAQWLEPAKHAAMLLTFAHALLARGDAAAAVAVLQQRVLPLSRTVGAPIEALVWNSLGKAHRDLGELREAISIWRGKALPLYRRLGRAANETMVRAFMARAMIELGDREAGLEIVRQEADGQRRWPISTIRDALDRRDATLQLASLLAQYGTIEEAKQLLRTALADTSFLWDQVKGELEPRLEALVAAPDSAEMSDLPLHTEAGPEIYAEQATTV